MRVASACMALTLVAATPLAAQSMAEIAKKEKERREALKAKGTRSKVITEEDLRAGRPKEAPSPSPAPGRPQSQSSGGTKASSSEGSDRPTEADRRREQAAAELQSKFSQMVDQGNTLISTARTYHSACTAGTGQPRDARCTAMEQQIEDLACAVGTTLDEVQEIARKGFLPPGVIREAREASGLDAPIWSQIQLLSRQHCKRP